MKYKEQELKIIAKSLYKSVKKRLSDEKHIINDFMDADYIAEEKHRVKPSKTKNLWKEEKGTKKLKKFIEKTRKT